MQRIGILSDTHAYLDPRIYELFSECHQVWHAGDIGSIGLAEQLEKFKPLKAVYGNIDGQEIRVIYPETQLFMVDEVKVMINHISGYPGRYDFRIPQKLNEHRPQILVGGHSHILKIMHDPKNHLLYINPGAAGRNGFHQVRTLVRLCIEGSSIFDCEVIELGKRSV